MGFRPLHDWALIKRDEPAEKTSGGIIIPDSAKDKPAEGVVLAIGPGKFVKEKGKKEKEKKEKKFVPTVLKKGDKVMFIEYMAKDIEVGTETITLIREDDILGTVEGVRDVMVKPAYQMEARQERPPMVQQAPAAASAAKPDKKSPVKTAPPKEAVSKKQAPAKKPAGKAVSGSGGKKKASPKPARKAGAASKVVKKVAKKTTKPSAGKAAKKTAAPKPAAKALKPKKAAPAKSASKKAVSSKTVKKTGKVSNKKTPTGKTVKAKGRKR